MATTWMLLIVSISAALSLSGVDSQLSLLSDILEVLQDVDDATHAMSATLPQMTASLANQESLQNVTNVLLRQNTNSLVKEISEIAAILPTLTGCCEEQVEWQQRRHNETVSIFSQIAETQSQMANAFNDVAGILRRQSQQLETITATMDSVVSVLANISDALPDVMKQQADQTNLLQDIKSSSGQQRQPTISTTLYTPTTTVTTTPGMETTTMTTERFTTVADFTTTSSESIVRDCKDLHRDCPSGVYTINPTGDLPYNIYCDMDTDGGGWTVFQRRFNGSVDFYRGWADYEEGFGSPYGEFWLGLSRVHQLTQLADDNVLRFDLQAFDGTTAYAKYDSFQIGGAVTDYILSIGSYTGNAPDSLTQNNNRPFTTYDRDNEQWAHGNCAVHSYGAWWYTAQCSPTSNLNGRYLSSGHQGIIWVFWKYWESLAITEMKMRRVD